MIYFPISFGWSRANPPDRRRYEVPIGPDDFVLLHRKGEDRLWPRYSLIDRLVHELTDPDGPRFAVITGLRKMLGFTDNQIHAFQTDILKRLGAKLGYRLFPSQNSYLDGLTSSKDLHFDNLEPMPLVSLAYGPFSGLKPGEGIPRLGDLKQWIQDTPRLKLAWLAKRWPNKENILRLFDGLDRRRDFQKSYLVRTHAIELDQLDYANDLPILFINNNITTGIAHGATPIHHLNGDERRPIIRRLLSNPR